MTTSNSKPRFENAYKTPYEPRIYRLLLRLREHGGWIVSEGSCTPEVIALAKVTDRYTLDSDGYGFVYIAPNPQT